VLTLLELRKFSPPGKENFWKCSHFAFRIFFPHEKVPTKHTSRKNPSGTLERKTTIFRDRLNGLVVAPGDGSSAPLLASSSVPRPPHHFPAVRRLMCLSTITNTSRLPPLRLPLSNSSNSSEV